MKPLAQVLIVWLMLWCVGLGLAAWLVGCQHHVWFWAALCVLVFPGYPLWSEAGTDAAPARQPPPDAPPLGARIPVRGPVPPGPATATVTTGGVTQTVPVTFTTPPPQEVS